MFKLSALSSRPRGGFTLVELAIVMGVVAMLSVGLWRIMSSSNEQLRAQSAAQQQRELAAALVTYFQSTAGNARVTALPNPGDTSPVDLAATGADSTFDDFWPTWFSGATTINAYGQTFEARVIRTASSFNVAILTRNGDTIPDPSGGRIASMIGADGGFVYATDVCNTAAGTTTSNAGCGAYGAWAQNILTLGFVGPVSGHIFSLTSGSAQSLTETDAWLARNTSRGGGALVGTGVQSLDLYTIQNHDVWFMNPPSAGTNDLYMGGNTIYGGSAAASLVGNTVGRLDNFLEAAIGHADAAMTTPRLSIFSSTACTINDISGGRVCPYALEVTGDVSISNVLTANILYAEAFTYKASDLSLKKDVKVIEHSSDKLSRIKGVSFYFKNETKKNYGVIAQDVEKIYPELVYEIGGGKKAVDYIGLIGPIIAAVNELKAENEALRRQLNQQGRTVQKPKQKAP